MLDETFQLIRDLPGVAGVKSTTNGHGVIVQCRSDVNVVSLREVCDNANLALVIEHVEAEITPEEAEIADLPRMIWFTITCLVATALGWILDDRANISFWIPAALYIVAYGFGGYYSLLDSIDSLKKREFDVNTLMIVAALGAAAMGEPREGALLMFLFSLSGTLETYAMGRTHASIRSLIAMTPREAELLIGGETRITSVEAIVPGDVVLVRPGAQIPADGVIRAGESTVNEASITGESMPVEKHQGAKVFAGTMNGQGALEVNVTADASQSTLARIVSVVREAREQKANSQDFTDRVIGVYYAYAVVIVTLLAIVVGRIFLAEDWSVTLYRAMTLMVVMSPCALVISIPAALLSALARAARDGVLFKGGRQLEAAATVKVVAFDKTGTLTTGRPGVVAIIPVGGPGRLHAMTAIPSTQTVPPDDQMGELTADQMLLLMVAAAVEQSSEHPLARAVVLSAKERGLPIPEASEFKAVIAAGATALVNGQRLRVGKPMLFGMVTPDVMIEVQAQQRNGNTVIAVGSDDEVWGLIAIADTMRPEAQQALRDLRAAGYRLALLTGDNEHVARALAKDLGLDDVRAELLPQDKVEAVRDLQQRYGPVAMIGDGINDAPALATAALGVAMGTGGTDVAHESADVVLMRDDLSRLASALYLARRAQAVVLQNLVFAFAVIAVLVIFTLKGDMILTYGVIGHEGSTLLVVANGLRMLLPVRQSK
jgi:Zn2+/Cd2+-exporting ATPase